MPSNSSPGNHGMGQCTMGVCTKRACACRVLRGVVGLHAHEVKTVPVMGAKPLDALGAPVTIVAFGAISARAGRPPE